jgi:hypothetical protein
MGIFSKRFRRKKDKAAKDSYVSKELLNLFGKLDKQLHKDIYGELSDLMKALEAGNGSGFAGRLQVESLENHILRTESLETTLKGVTFNDKQLKR